MPHLSIDYSPTLERQADVERLCRALHQVLLGIDAFPDAGIRIRAHKADYAIVADGHDANDFVAMTLSVGAGRETAVLKAAGDALFAAAQATQSGRNCAGQQDGPGALGDGNAERRLQRSTTGSSLTVSDSQEWDVGV